MNIEKIEEKHDRMQRLIFLGASVGSIGFALQELIKLLDGPDSIYLLLTVVTLAGWLIGAWAMIATSSLMKEKGIENILNDERFERIRGKSFEFGFAALLAAQITLLVGNDMLIKFTDIELTVSFATNLSIAVAFVASLGRFVYLNR